MQQTQGQQPQAAHHDMQPDMPNADGLLQAQQHRDQKAQHHHDQRGLPHQARRQRLVIGIGAMVFVCGHVDGDGLACVVPERRDFINSSNNWPRDRRTRPGAGTKKPPRRVASVHSAVARQTRRAKAAACPT